MPTTIKVSLEIPQKEKSRWLKSVLELSDTEMTLTLDVSPKTLANWLKDSNDTAALESVRFDRLLKLVEQAKGVIRADELGHWMHTPNKALGGLIPAKHLGDEAGYSLMRHVMESLLDP
jgi:hypothetical protein